VAIVEQQTTRIKQTPCWTNSHTSISIEQEESLKHFLPSNSDSRNMGGDNRYKENKKQETPSSIGGVIAR
jgi:hypothetical protein